MLESDYYRVVHELIERYGEDAPKWAASQADVFDQKGEALTAEIWRRLEITVEDFFSPRLAVEERPN